MKKSKHIVNYLNQLLIVNYEAEKIFLKALDEVDNSVLKNFFRVSGYERNHFIKQLDSNIRQKGGTPTYPDVLSKSHFKLSTQLSKIISNKNEKLLFTEIGKIQILDIEIYQKTLFKFEFPEAIELLLKKQKNKIVNSLYSIEVHKDLFAKKMVSFD